MGTVERARRWVINILIACIANGGCGRTDLDGDSAAPADSSTFTSGGVTPSAGGDATTPASGGSTQGAGGGAAPAGTGTALVPPHCSSSASLAIKSVAAGYGHACVLLSNTGVRCWGANAAGQLGDGTTTDRSSMPAGDAFVGATAVGSRKVRTHLTISSNVCRYGQCLGIFPTKVTQNRRRCVCETAYHSDGLILLTSARKSIFENLSSAAFAAASLCAGDSFPPPGSAGAAASPSVLTWDIAWAPLLKAVLASAPPNAEPNATPTLCQVGASPVRAK